MLTAYPRRGPTILVCMTAGGLVDALPRDNDPDALYEAFMAWSEEQGLTLYPHQEEAAIELFSGNNVILATPTGCGKSMVAIAAHFAAMADDEITYYTAPIKALVSEKFFALCAIFGAENVGMLTGDASVNSRAPIIACTAEVLANIALREGADADIGQVVMDEFHFYADPQRGWAWQVPILMLPQAQFLLMSATLGDVSHLREDLTDRTRRETALIDTAERPVPLHFTWSLEPLHELIEELVRADQAPVYVVHFTQASALERAQSLLARQALHARGARRDRRRDRRLPLHRRVRQDALAARAGRHRRPPRRHAPALPATDRAARADRAAEGRGGHGHAGRRHQRPDPHRRLHRPGEVRRHQPPPAEGPRVPPDRGPRGPRRFRHGRLRRRPGARAHDRERAPRWPRPATTPSRRSASRRSRRPTAR